MGCKSRASGKARDQCDRCPTCLGLSGNHLHSQIQQSQAKAQYYQEQEELFEVHEERVRAEEDRRELERRRATKPIKQEQQEVESRRKSWEAERLRHIDNELLEAVMLLSLSHSRKRLMKVDSKPRGNLWSITASWSGPTRLGS